MQTNLMPLAVFDLISLEELNEALVRWGHQMGPIHRPYLTQCYGLWVLGDLVAVASMDTFITEEVAGIARDDGIELSRLCASGPTWNRVMLRMWREIAFMATGREWAVSYQDKRLHTGNLYRFDGWREIGASRSGTDQRSGRKGRDKRIWGWRRPNTEAGGGA